MASIWIPNRIRNWFTGGGLRQPERGEQRPGPSYAPPEAGVVHSEERALMLSTVFACVRIIAETVSGLPLQFHRVDREGVKTRLQMDEHNIVNLFRKPNRQMDGLNFRESMTMQLALQGNCYSRITWSGTSNNSRPVNLTPMPFGAVVPFRADDGTVVFIWYRENDQPLVLPQSEVLHIKLFSTEGIVGLSPLGYARHAMGMSVAAEKYAGGVFANGGRPIGVLQFADQLTADQREQARKIHQSITEGPEKSSNAWVLEGGAEYKELTMRPDDMQMLESRSFQVPELCRFFGVPPHMVGHTEKSTTWGTGLESMNRGFLQYTIASYLNRWRWAIEDQLLMGRDKRTILPEHDTEAFLRGDSKSFADYLAKLAQNGYITRNEGRRKLGMEPLDQPMADELTIQVNLTDDIQGPDDAATPTQSAIAQ